MAAPSRKTGPGTAVRFGGHAGPGGHVFELTGGHLCLDLANTLDERRAAEPRELLRGFTDLVAWGVQSGAIMGATGGALRRQALRDPHGAAQALDRARGAREEIFAIFSALAGGHAPPAPSLGRLEGAIAEAFSSRRLTLVRGRAAWSWPESAPPHLDRVLWAAVVSAAELVTSAESSRVRRCEGERCAWLFLDRSKNRSRRWCDMSVCGNRMKARRHQARVRGAPGPRERTRGPRGQAP